MTDPHSWLILAHMRLPLLLLLLGVCWAAGEPDGDRQHSSRRLQAGPRPQCPAAFATLVSGRRVRLPTCTAAPAAKPAAAAVAAAKPAAAAAAVADSYPCAVGDVTCYCLWRQSIGSPLGYYADTETGCQ